MPINTNLCRNKFIKHDNHSIMLQTTSIYSQGDGTKWEAEKMMTIMIEIAKTSLDVLSSELNHK